MLKYILLLVLLATIQARSYPEYKQCHKSWKDQKMGATNKTICEDGSLMASAAMALNGIGMDYNPLTLNKWLMTHGGYIHGNTFVWASMNSLTMEYQGKIGNFLIQKKINEGYVVICRVNNGSHYVLAHSHLNDKIHVNDPAENKSTYLLTEIDDGETAIFSLTNPDSQFKPKLDDSDKTDNAIENIVKSIVNMNTNIFKQKTPILENIARSILVPRDEGQDSIVIGNIAQSILVPREEALNKIVIGNIAQSILVPRDQAKDNLVAENIAKEILMPRDQEQDSIAIDSILKSILMPSGQDNLAAESIAKEILMPRDEEQDNQIVDNIVKEILMPRDEEQDNIVAEDIARQIFQEISSNKQTQNIMDLVSTILQNSESLQNIAKNPEKAFNLLRQN